MGQNSKEATALFADLHVHSVFSDGTMSPAQLAAAAKQADVGLIALADHNTFGGQAEMRAACAAAGVACIDAVEIDSLFHGVDLHILAYGADPACPIFAKLVRFARAKLDGMSVDLVRCLSQAGYAVSVEEYDRFPEQTGRGGWKALYYLEAAGVVPAWPDVFALYDAYGVTYAAAGFPESGEVIRAIHEAGGYAVLAHPGDVFQPGEKEPIPAPEMIPLVDELFQKGLDGVECWYPKHSEDDTRLYLDAARRHGGLITSGSDCHGDFSGKPVGYLRTPIEALALGGIVQKDPSIKTDSGLYLTDQK